MRRKFDNTPRVLEFETFSGSDYRRRIFAIARASQRRDDSFLNYFIASAKRPPTTTTPLYRDKQPMSVINVEATGGRALRARA